MKAKKLSNDEINNIVNFLNAAVEATKDCLEADFECPVCGDTAHAIKSTYNGHHRGFCSNCHANFIE